MKNSLKKLRPINMKYSFYALILVILFSILVYPPNIGISRSQKIKTIVKDEFIYVSKTDSLAERMRITDSLIKEKCRILKKQQKTLINYTKNK